MESLGTNISKYFPDQFLYENQVLILTLFLLIHNKFFSLHFIFYCHANGKLTAQRHKWNDILLASTIHFELQMLLSA